MKKGKEKGGVTEKDAALWQHAMRHTKAYKTEDKKPLSKQSPTKNRPTEKKTSSPDTRSSIKTLPTGIKKISTDIPIEKQGFDRATEVKLKKGKLPIEGRIDLHGMTQEEAHRALHRFITLSRRNARRTILVITGKGRAGGGILRKMLPLWLEETSLKKAIVAITPAQPKDGGDGAFYLRLKKPDRI